MFRILENVEIKFFKKSKTFFLINDLNQISQHITSLMR